MFCREGRVGLRASFLFVVSFSCSKCERFMVKIGRREGTGDVYGILEVRLKMQGYGEQLRNQLGISTGRDHEGR